MMISCKLKTLASQTCTIIISFGQSAYIVGHVIFQDNPKFDVMNHFRADTRGIASVFF